MERFQCDVDRSYHPHLNPLPSKGEEEDAENRDQWSESAANSQHSTINSQLVALAARKPGVFLPECLKQCVVAAKNVALGSA